VAITDQLDLTHDDLTIFGFGPITFGNHLISPPPLQTNFSTTVDLRPANNLLVAVSGNLDNSTGLVTWKFVSLDPATGQPTTDPTLGFLPPGGEGNVVFTVMPEQGLPTGTQIRNQASIVFDVNAPIATPTWLNTLDYTKLMSQVLPLAAIQPSPTFQLQWSGMDEGSGILDYSIFVSQDGGPFTAFLLNTTATAAMFAGQGGSTYAFYSLARDQAGNQEEAKTTPDTTTRVAVTNVCPQGQGFWKNRPAAWPVTSLTVGSATYTQADLLTILGTPMRGDASLILADQLIAAKLNLARGSNPTPIRATIPDADGLLIGQPPFNVDPASATGQRMVDDSRVLDAYNNGELTPNCAP